MGKLRAKWTFLAEEYISAIVVDKPNMIGYIVVIEDREMIRITDSKRIEMLDNGRKSDKSDATIRMYGPALMGLPTLGGNLDMAPQIGDKFCAASKPETTAEITAIIYRADRNYVELTCKRSDGKEFVQPFNRLYEAIKSGQAEVK